MVTYSTPFAHIVRNPAILGGEPIVAGTRITVRTVVLMHRLYKDVVGIQQTLPHLSRAEIEEALSYYESNRAEIVGYISQNDVDAELLHREEERTW